ncbi:hypothetical protein BFZC1_08805 [Lysinibacillus fusiformis ZC1]|uniref:DUF2577 domain-containing protein n=2 Tax=Lysinibacillus capsici TaxID=2115968 RepID=UPI0001DA5673|nr:DUF2577 domain-containing protein [Lysinibacillus capsici]EFI68942.1 hypothetical protein BFZC1_08805 [Lysinibacillus fusiformis ZC1]EKU42496.1 hypothetical protein C518_2638 [Lysinibacillus fusiformis ZB2]MBU5253958.1 DUF2577 domain-containing protein [Lysinibacillus capsici]
MMSLLDLIKTTAMAAFQASNPVNIVVGEVIESKPLKIEVHSKLILTDEFLLVAEHLTRHERIVSIAYEYAQNFSSGRMGDAWKQASSSRKNIRESEPNPYEKYDMKYAKFIFEDGLKIGDKVVLHRVQGGQRYFVSDRYKEGDKVW